MLPSSMATEKRSVSLASDLAAAIDAQAKREGTSFSAWLTQSAWTRIHQDEGRQGLAEWELENGPLTVEELKEGLARARALLQDAGSDQRGQKSA